MPCQLIERSRHSRYKSKCATFAALNDEQSVWLWHISQQCKAITYNISYLKMFFGRMEFTRWNMSKYLDYSFRQLFVSYVYLQNFFSFNFIPLFLKGLIFDDIIWSIIILATVCEKKPSKSYDVFKFCARLSSLIETQYESNAIKDRSDLKTFQSNI